MSSASVKREATDGGDAAAGFPHKLQRVVVDGHALPVSPTVAAGVLPRSTSSFSTAACVTTTTAVAATRSRPDDLAGVVDPVATLDAIRAQLALSSDPHLQAKLLLAFSHAAIAPGAPTNAAIDFLFSFLQASQQQQQQAPSASPPQQPPPPDATAINRGGGGPIVVGAIVRGLRKLLGVKAAVVEPMIQVDAMGEQLMQCVSVADDCKLRRDMLAIVLDCLVLTRAFASASKLLQTCVRDHDSAMQALCLDGFLRLWSAGHCYDPQAAASLCDTAAALLLRDSADATVKVSAARLLAVLANAHPLLEASASTSELAAPLSLRDRMFYALCLATRDASPRVRCEVALSLRQFALATPRVIEHALQKAPVSEELNSETSSDDSARLETVLLLASGALLDLLEDKCRDVADEASRTVRVLAATSRLSEPTLDRTIAAHVDLLPNARSDAAEATLVETLEHLLQQRKRQFGAAFSLTNEEVSVVLSDCEPRTRPRAMLAVLAALVQCDMASVWMAQRVVEYALRIADALDSNGSDDCVTGESATDGKQSTQQLLLMLADTMQRECGAALQLDVQLLDALETARGPPPYGRSVKAQVAARLLQRQSTHMRDCEGSSSDASAVAAGDARSVRSLFKLAVASPSQASRSTKNLLDTSHLLHLSAADSVANALKAIQRLRMAARGSSSVLAVLQLVELLLQLKQQVRHARDATSAAGAAENDGVVAAPTASGSSYVSMTAMLAPSSSDNNSSNATVTAATRPALLSTAAVHSCRALVTLATRVFAIESALSSGPRTDLAQLVLLARVGIVLGELQDAASSDHDVSAALAWIAHESAQLQPLQHHNTAFWLSAALVTGHAVSTLDDLALAFAESVGTAWPRALLETLSTLTPSRAAAAKLLEPLHNSSSNGSSSSREPREIVAQWPFAVRVRASVTHVRDLTRLYIQSVLPNGETTYHRVPVRSVRVQSPTQCVVDHTLSLTVPPFSDPTSYAIALCVAHPALPGANERLPSPLRVSGVNNSSYSSRDAGATVAYTAISDAVHTRISHRTNSGIRRG